MAELVGDPGDERRLGADDHEVEVGRAHELQHRLGVLGAHRVAVTERRDAGISRCGVELVERGRRGQPPRERMLAPACAEEEHLHRRESRGRTGGFKEA